MGVQLAFQGALQDDLGEPAEQAARPSQLQALGLRPLGQLPGKLQLGRVRLAALAGLPATRRRLILLSLLPWCSLLRRLILSVLSQELHP
jgi:hypothetical protein